MIGLLAHIQVVDNAGVKIVRYIKKTPCKERHPLRGGEVGDRILCACWKPSKKGHATSISFGSQGGTTSSVPAGNPTKGKETLKKGELVWLLLIRNKYEKQRINGRILRFDDTSGVLIKKKGEGNKATFSLVVTRITGPISKELRLQTKMKPLLVSLNGQI